jgi:hypothetical protein
MIIEPYKIVICVLGGWLIPITWVIMRYVVKDYYERKRHNDLMERLLKKYD